MIFATEAGVNPSIVQAMRPLLLLRPAQFSPHSHSAASLRSLMGGPPDFSPTPMDRLAWGTARASHPTLALRQPPKSLHAVSPRHPYTTKATITKALAVKRPSIVTRLPILSPTPSVVFCKAHEHLDDTKADLNEPMHLKISIPRFQIYTETFIAAVTTGASSPPPPRPGHRR
jgi:hypothetical protein